MEKYYSINQQHYSVRCKVYYQDLKQIKKVVVFGHGFGGHKDNKAAQRFAQKLMSKHKEFAVVTFNWPTHGDDARKNLLLSECDLYLDFVIDDCKERFHTQKLYGYATSFGGYLFLKHIHEKGNPFIKTALRAPAIKMSEDLEHHIMDENQKEQLKKGKPVLVGFDRKIKINQGFFDDLKANDISQWDFTDDYDKVLLLMGGKDQIVSLDAVKAFSEENVMDLKIYEKADHRFQDPQIMDLAIADIITYFNEE